MLWTKRKISFPVGFVLGLTNVAVHASGSCGIVNSWEDEIQRFRTYSWNICPGGFLLDILKASLIMWPSDQT